VTKKPTRREFLKAAGAGVAGIAVVEALGCESEKQAGKTRSSKTISTVQSGLVRAFRSRPDLKPPVIEVRTRAHEVASGYVFVAPKRGTGQDGPMILDNRGEPVWFYPVREKPPEDRYATDFKVQNYRGEPVLTWWEGVNVPGHGSGGYVVMDGSYHEVGRIPASDSYDRDLHEFNITSRGTALFTVYDRVPMDLTFLGGLKDDVAYNGIVEEMDIETGEVLFEWRSLDHVGVEESYRKSRIPGEPYDYFHINSIEVDHDGNLLVSSRNTWTVYKIDRRSGEVMWRLGGKKSDFEMGPDTRTAFQHDARRHPDGTITIFDNREQEAGSSRGIVLELDENEMRASLVREYIHPDRIYAATQGNMQVLPNGNVFIGWGSEPGFSEFGKDGELLFDAAFRVETDPQSTKQLPKPESYRAFRFEWSGKPDTIPDVAAKRASSKRMRVHASWNGATEVATWQVLAGPGRNRLQPVGSAPREGFETTISMRAVGPYVAVKAKDGSGRVLGTSEVVKT
jgi:hypothetical protein